MYKAKQERKMFSIKFPTIKFELSRCERLSSWSASAIMQFLISFELHFPFLQMLNKIDSILWLTHADTAVFFFYPHGSWSSFNCCAHVMYNIVSIDISSFYFHFSVDFLNASSRHWPNIQFDSSFGVFQKWIPVESFRLSLAFVGQNWCSIRSWFRVSFDLGPIN